MYIINYDFVPLPLPSIYRPVTVPLPSHYRPFTVPLPSRYRIRSKNSFKSLSKNLTKYCPNMYSINYDFVTVTVTVPLRTVSSVTKRYRKLHALQSVTYFI